MRSLTKESLRIFLNHAMRYKWPVFIISIGVLAVTAVDIFKPFLYKRFFDLLVLTDLQNTRPLIEVLIYILLITIANRLVWAVMLLVNSYFQPRVMSDLLNTCYKYIQDHSYRFFSDNFVGSLVTKVRRYQKSFEDIADQVFFEMGRTLIITVSIIIATMVFNRTIGLIMLAWSVVFVIFSFYFSKFKLPYDLKRAKIDTKTTGQLADTITNNINLKIFTSDKRENSLFQSITYELFQARRKSWRLGSYGELVQGVLVIALEFGLMYYAVTLWQKDLISIGGFALLQSYLGRIFDKLWGLGKHIRTLYESMADANEMTELLVKEHEVQDVAQANPLKVKLGNINFENISFAYNQTPIFENFSLYILHRQKVALIGPSGGGKTTIVKLLFRFFDIQGGRILIDNQDISEVTQESLRKQIGLVPQEPILFHRSLLDNIKYGKSSASREEVIQAAKLAHCHEFINRFPQGYDTFVGERGIKLSGGERQRVAIARAILKTRLS